MFSPLQMVKGTRQLLLADFLHYKLKKQHLGVAPFVCGFTIFLYSDGKRC